MKHFLITLFLFTGMATQAQTYYAMPTQQGFWYNQQLADFFQPQPVFYNYTLTGDTVIDGISYHKLYSGSYIGALHEEDKTVYYRPANAATESLLYNFNLTLGDTIFNAYTAHCLPQNMDTLVVGAIDSVACADGNYHKRFLILNPAYTGFGEYIIEGIGSMHGIVNPWYDVYYENGGQRLNCAMGNSGPIYALPNAECLTTIDESAIANLTVYLSPVVDVLHIQSTQPIKSITLFNLNGSRVFYQVDNTLINTIPTQNLPAGMYIVEVNLGKEVVWKKVIVVR